MIEWNLDNCIHSITSWHALGYNGRGIRVAVLDPERFLYNYQAGAIQRPLGESGKAGGHLGQCCAVLQQIAPGAELFALGTDRAAWEWVLANDIDIVSCSYAAGAINAALLPRLEQSNLITFAAAGNGADLESGADRAYPSCYDWTISVGAYCPNLDQLEPYTNGGEALDCVAYTDFAVLNNQGKAIEFTGTSCATAVAAAIMALVLQKEGRQKGWQWAKEYIRRNSKDILDPGKDLASGYGLFTLSEIEGDTVEIKLKIGSKTAYVDGKPVELGRAPEEQGGYTLVPVRFIAEALGCQVEYGGNVSREIIITTKTNAVNRRYQC